LCAIFSSLPPCCDLLKFSLWPVRIPSNTVVDREQRPIDPGAAPRETVPYFSVNHSPTKFSNPPQNPPLTLPSNPFRTRLRHTPA